MQLVITGRVDPRVIQEIIARRPDLTLKVWNESGIISREQLLAWAEDADLMITMLTERVDTELLEHAPHLKIVSNMAVGFDNFDLDALEKSQVLATNTPDVLTEATAELTMALMLLVLRRLRSAEDALRQHHWTGWEPDGFLGLELYGKTLGIAGFGRIARSVVRRALAFGMRVIIFTRRALKDLPENVQQVSWEQLLESSDILSLHVPLTPQTFHLINRESLSRIKPTAILINTSRGAVIDEQALIEALRTGKLAGAGLDVFETEPLPPDSPLRALPNVTLLPHVGSATVETRLAMAQRAWHNILAYLNGQKPPDLLLPKLWSDKT
ncbi:2-hydroxyacid dehydrogenase [Sulfobacillus thermosulfidooxidans]|uniref:2-hydroxyacid dehydrogenase n=1 Tax=Sulfobacillus thermosulfidooxidans TaxID=28034 RepID=UPI00031BF0F1|nr:D-glycerate dehydrogenase [Sulfobacillus thermosulfidooxidans]